MMGDYVRDKDAVTASMMVAEMAAHYHKQGMTLLDAMESLYEKYGFRKLCTFPGFFKVNGQYIDFDLMILSLTE